MWKRLGTGVVEGVVVSVLVSALIHFLAPASEAVFAYGGALATGVLTGLVAGKPVWARLTLAEAAVKVVAGSFLATASLYGVRKWLPGVTVDLGPFGAGPLGSVPLASLSVIAIAVALVFEIDDRFGPDAAIGVPVDPSRRPE
jgi:hypothetical protein